MERISKKTKQNQKKKAKPAASPKLSLALFKHTLGLPGPLRPSAEGPALLMHLCLISGDLTWDKDRHVTTRYLSATFWGSFMMSVPSRVARTSGRSPGDKNTDFRFLFFFSVSNCCFTFKRRPYACVIRSAASPLPPASPGSYSALSSSSLLLLLLLSPSSLNRV